MDVSNSYSWAILQKLSVSNFEWIEGTSQFNKKFIKNYNEESNEGYFLEVDFNTQKNYMNFAMTYHLYQKR